MTLGDGIRRNIAHVDPTERALLKDAILEMHRRFYPGNKGALLPGGGSWWFKQDEIHQATHVHGGPEFLPWHREMSNRFEGLSPQINPQLSLHYWDFKEDPHNIPNGNIGGGMNGTVKLFAAIFMDLVQSLNYGLIWLAIESLSHRGPESARRPFLKCASKPCGAAAGPNAGKRSSRAAVVPALLGAMRHEFT